MHERGRTQTVKKEMDEWLLHRMGRTILIITLRNKLLLVWEERSWNWNRAEDDEVEDEACTRPTERMAIPKAAAASRP